MRTVLVTPIFCLSSLCSLCVTCQVATAQQPAQPAAQRIQSDSGLFRRDSLGFQVPIPTSMIADTLFQRVVNSQPSNNAHMWQFLELEPGDTWSPGKSVQRVFILATEGAGITEPDWNKFAAGLLKSTLAQETHGKILENVVRWRADTAEVRLAVHSVLKGEYVHWRCLGSQVGRRRPAVICVQTTGPTVEALAAVREGLVLIPQLAGAP